MLKTPIPSPEVRTLNTFENATTMPQLAPFAAEIPSAPGTVPVIVTASATDVDVEVDAAPSRQDLLQWAAEGPIRTTRWSMLPGADPILGLKMKPHVAERRARFRRVVKVALGACVACCLVATAASALSSGNTPTSTASGVNAKTAPAAGVILAGKLDQPVRTKAASQRAGARDPHAAVAARPAPKTAKRR